MAQDDADQQVDFKEKISNDIFSVIGAADLPDEEKGILLAKMMDLIQTRTLMRATEGLDDDKKEKLSDLAEAGDTEAVESFLFEEVPSFERMFEEEAEKLRNELIVEFAE
ncbi:MAG: hypothetical protein WCT32_00850 [Patescibacteria group bacterium]|jgi:hypothetical protein